MALVLENTAALIALGLTPLSIALTALRDGLDPQEIMDAVGPYAYKEARAKEAAERLVIRGEVRAEMRACKPSDDPGRGHYRRMLHMAWAALNEEYGVISSADHNPYAADGKWPADFSTWALSVKRADKDGNPQSTGSLTCNVGVDAHSTITSNRGVVTAGPIALGVRWDGRQKSRNGASGAMPVVISERPVPQEDEVARAGSSAEE